MSSDEEVIDAVRVEVGHDGTVGAAVCSARPAWRVHVARARWSGVDLAPSGRVPGRGAAFLALALARRLGPGRGLRLRPGRGLGAPGQQRGVTAASADRASAVKSAVSTSSSAVVVRSRSWEWGPGSRLGSLPPKMPDCGGMQTRVVGTAVAGATHGPAVVVKRSDDVVELGAALDAGDLVPGLAIPPGRDGLVAAELGVPGGADDPDAARGRCGHGRQQDVVRVELGSVRPAPRSLPFQRSTRGSDGRRCAGSPRPRPRDAAGDRDVGPAPPRPSAAACCMALPAAVVAPEDDGADLGSRTTMAHDPEPPPWPSGATPVRLIDSRLPVRSGR